MFEFCADPASLSGLDWLACYLTTGKHFAFYRSFGTVIALLVLAVPPIMLLGFLGALARRSHILPLHALGWGYTTMVRGVPDIVFFLFVPIALDQGIEWTLHQVQCPDWTEPIRRGNDFVVCPEAKVPPSAAEPWISRFPRVVDAMESADRLLSAPLGRFADHGLLHLERTEAPGP